MQQQETQRQALEREIFEELSVQVIHSSFLGSHKHHYPDLAINLHCHVVSKWSGEFKLTDHDAMHWYRIAQLEKLELCEADEAFKPLIRNFMAARS